MKTTGGVNGTAGGVYTTCVGAGATGTYVGVGDGATGTYVGVGAGAGVSADTGIYTQ